MIPPCWIQVQWSRHVEFWFSDPASLNSDSVIPPRWILIEWSRHIVFWFSDPALFYSDWLVIVLIFIERLRDFLYSVIPPRACWFNMVSLVQCARHVSSDKVIPPCGYSEKVVPPDTNWPCILNPGWDQSRPGGASTWSLRFQHRHSIKSVKWKVFIFDKDTECINQLVSLWTTLCGKLMSPTPLSLSNSTLFVSWTNLILSIYDFDPVIELLLNHHHHKNCSRISQWCHFILVEFSFFDFVKFLLVCQSICWHFNDDHGDNCLKVTLPPLDFFPEAYKFF